MVFLLAAFAASGTAVMFSRDFDCFLLILEHVILVYFPSIAGECFISLCPGIFIGI